MPEIRQYAPLGVAGTGVGIMLYGANNFIYINRLGDDDPASLSNRILSEKLGELKIINGIRSEDPGAAVTAILDITHPNRPGGILNKLSLRDINNLPIPPGCETVTFEPGITALSQQIVYNDVFDTTGLQGHLQSCQRQTESLIPVDLRNGVASSLAEVWSGLLLTVVALSYISLHAFKSPVRCNP